MKVFLIVGEKGQGKSIQTRKLIQEFNRWDKWIFDVNAEYTKEGTKRKIQKAIRDNDVKGAQLLDNYIKTVDFGKINTNVDFEAFQARASRLKNHMIIYEEATAFFSSKGREKHTMNVITRSRHVDSPEPGSGNLVVLIFHSLRAVPNVILDLCDYMYLFPTTMDSPSYVEKKFEGHLGITNAFNELRQEGKNHQARFIVI